MFLFACLVLLAGYPVAFSLAGSALLFAFVGELTGTFDASFLQALPNRLYGIMTNSTLVAVPLFVFMGVMLERSKVADQLLVLLDNTLGIIQTGANSENSYSHLVKICPHGLEIVGCRLHTYTDRSQ